MCIELDSLELPLTPARSVGDIDYDEYSKDAKLRPVRNSFLFHKMDSFVPFDFHTGEGDFLYDPFKKTIHILKTNKVVSMGLRPYQCMDTELGMSGFKYIHNDEGDTLFALVDARIHKDLAGFLKA